MRHNITLTKENSALLRKLQVALGLKPSAVIVNALHALEEKEAKREKEVGR
jgi:hypothetical protein